MSSVGTVDSMVTAASNLGKEQEENNTLTPPVTPPPHEPASKQLSHSDTSAAVVPGEDDVAPAVPPKPSTDSAAQTEAEYLDIATKLFHEEFVSIQPEEYTQFLAAGDEESTHIRTHYMNLFRWEASLLKSTRLLCAKLYLKGESQEIDRILSSFTKAYIKQHPQNVFCTRNFEKIYIIIYSLILLNTALHNSELSKKSKISQSDYIKNTFTTFIHQNPKSSKKLSIKQRIAIERELSNFYEELSKNELHLKQSDEDTNSVAGSSAADSASKRLSRHSSSAKHKNRNSTFSERSVDHSHPTENEVTKESKQEDLNGSANTTTTALGVTTPDSSETVAKLVANNDEHGELPDLSRQVSNSSIWSTDSNNRRTSLVMKRMSSATSAVSQYTVTNTTNQAPTNSRSNRVGFTRALASDQNQKFYKNANSSRNSNVSAAGPFTIRNRQSLDYLRGAPTTSLQNQNAQQSTVPGQVHGMLNKRASRSSIISRESANSINGEDTVSVLSFDTVNLNNLNIGDEHYLNDGESQRQHLEDFNVDDYQDQYDLTLELQGSPYLKEGLLKLKILNNDQQDTTSNELSSGSTSSANSTTSTTNLGSNRFFSFFSRNNNASQQAPSFPAPRNPTSPVGTSTNLLSNKFVENFVVVSKGELSLYSFDQKVIKKHQQKIRKFKQKQLVVITELDEEDELADQDNIGDGNWLKNAAKIGNYNLCSTFAQLEPPTTNNGRKVILWSLTFPKVSKKQPKKFIFEAGTKEIALEYINTCNFWASKITAIPTLEESVSSIEYGWTNLDGIISKKDQFKKAKNIMKWEQLPKGIYLSNYIVVSSESDNQANHEGMMKQFVKTLNYYNHLKKLYNDFTYQKLKFSKSLPVKQFGGSNYTRVVNNYNAKVQEYKSELTKYKNYLIILGFGLQLRFDLESQDREDEYEEQRIAYELKKESEESNEETRVHADSAATSVEGSDKTEAAEVKSASNSGSGSLTPKIHEDDELTRLVKFEIKKLFFNMKDISKVIPTFQASKSINNLTNLVKEQYFADHGKPSPLVKSPKTFKLSNYNDNESPVNQLLKSSGSITEEIQDIVHNSYSTNTIEEEEEPEEQELEVREPETVEVEVKA